MKKGEELAAFPSSFLYLLSLSFCRSRRSSFRTAYRPTHKYIIYPHSQSKRNSIGLFSFFLQCKNPEKSKLTTTIFDLGYQDHLPKKQNDGRRKRIPADCLPEHQNERTRSHNVIATLTPPTSDSAQHSNIDEQSKHPYLGPPILVSYARHGIAYPSRAGLYHLLSFGTVKSARTTPPSPHVLNGFSPPYGCLPLPLFRRSTPPVQPCLSVPPKRFSSPSFQFPTC